MNDSTSQRRLQSGRIIAFLFKLINKELHERLWGCECSVAPERMFTNCKLLLSLYRISTTAVWLWIFHVSVKNTPRERERDGVHRGDITPLQVFFFFVSEIINRSQANVLTCLFMRGSSISCFIVSTLTLEETVKRWWMEPRRSDLSESLPRSGESAACTFLRTVDFNEFTQLISPFDTVWKEFSFLFGNKRGFSFPQHSETRRGKSGVTVLDFFGSPGLQKSSAYHSSRAFIQALLFKKDTFYSDDEEPAALQPLK